MLLEPWDGDTFRVNGQQFSDRNGFAAFSMGPDGRAESVNVSGGAFTAQALFERASQDCVGRRGEFRSAPVSHQLSVGSKQEEKR